MFRGVICFSNVTVFFLTYFGFMIPMLWAKNVWLVVIHSLSCFYIFCGNSVFLYLTLCVSCESPLRLSLQSFEASTGVKMLFIIPL